MLILAAIFAIFVYGMMASMLGTILSYTSILRTCDFSWCARLPFSPPLLGLAAG